MNNFENKSIITETYKDFQLHHNIQLPMLNEVKFVKEDSFWARFQSQELYNKKYILYVNEELFQKNNYFIEQTLYHEFTHLMDSLKFLSYDSDNFKKVMISYSEFHASEIEMLKRLEQVEGDISLQSEIYHVGILSIQYFMTQSFEHLLKDLELMSNNSNIKNFYFNTNKLFYFFGYISALKQYKIDYDFNIYKVPSLFLNVCIKLNSMIINNLYSIDDIINLYKKLESDIKMNCLINQIIN